MDTVKFNKKNVKMVAHRGLSGLERENSNAAFVAAGNRSYFGIETDVHKTADGKFVVIHDDVTGRVANENLPVEGSSFEELRGLLLSDMDGSFREDLIIPTLDDYIKICSRYDKVCVLELKNAFTAKEIYEIVDIIKMREYLDKVIFISFCLENLLILKEKYPEQPAMLLCGFIPDDVIEMLAEKKLGIDVHYPALFENSGFYERLRDAGLEINCWTCDGTADGERLAELGVDYITTNILE